MIDSISTALSGLKAFEKKTDVISNNIANAATDNFKKSRTVLEETSPNGVKVSIRQIDTPGMPKEIVNEGEIEMTETSNVDLIEELTELIPATVGYQSNLKTLQTQEEMLGALLDVKNMMGFCSQAI